MVKFQKELYPVPHFILDEYTKAFFVKSDLNESLSARLAERPVYTY